MRTRCDRATAGSRPWSASCRKICSARSYRPARKKSRASSVSAASRVPSLEVGAIDDVLVHADGALHLAAPAIQAAEREVRVDRLVVDLGQAQEDLERAVGLVVEQEPHALEVAGPALDAGACAAPACATV